MKVAVVGSRNIKIKNLHKYLPKETTEIVSGGAVGVDSCAADYARQAGLKLTKFLPEYEKYGKCAPLKRNLTIIDYADYVLVFWNGRSKGTKFVIENCVKRGKRYCVYKTKQKDV